MKDLVTVTYESEKDKVAAYEEGTLTAAGEGKTVVTAIVTANENVPGYGGVAMEYSTAGEVTKEAPPAHTHDMTKIDPTEPTCTAEVNIEYWYCEDCGKYFRDAEGKTEITKEDTVLPMKEHEWEDDYTIDKEATETEDGSKSIHCKNCTAKKDVQVIPATGKPGGDNKPGTGDGSTGGSGGTGNADSSKPGAGSDSQAAGTVKTGDSANPVSYTHLDVYKRQVVWESDDLVNWSEPWLSEIAPEGAGCTWAPEFIYDEKTGEYVVYWSATKLEVDENEKVTQEYENHAIYYCKTRDFRTFTEPTLYRDGGTDASGKRVKVIDSDVYKRQ